MSNAKSCNNCGAVLVLDAKNGREDDAGELYGWVTIAAAGLNLDACTRSCATELLADGGVLAATLDAYIEQIAWVTRAITDEDGEQG